MRDLQHWKDKVELSLDGRQLFFLFFGGAIGACLLFALGVMTGRRIEARAIAMEAPRRSPRWRRPPRPSRRSRSPSP
jgi:hypothetical protein